MTTDIIWVIVDEHTGFRLPGEWHSIGRANAERAALAVEHADEMRDAEARLDDYIIVMYEDTRVGVHMAHCCKLHGCKYTANDADCPVAGSFETQMYPCPVCVGQDEAREKALDALVKGMNERMREVYRRNMPDTYGASPEFEFFTSMDFEPEVDILIEAGLLDIEVPY